MVDKIIFIEKIILSIKIVAFPKEGFAIYKHEKMYSYYYNFIDFFLTNLFDDSFLSDCLEEERFKEWGVKKETIHEIKSFAKNLENFYWRHEESDDFTLLRDNYWDEFVAQAKKCVVLLEEDLANMK